MFIVLEVPDNFNPKKKFASHQVMGCGDMECGYFTLDLKMLVNHWFHDPRHHGLPFVSKEGEEE